jgi:bifunctional non-homologous end joining protein LigD
VPRPLRRLDLRAVSEPDDPPADPPAGGAPDPLARYRDKRSAGATPEPIGVRPVAGRPASAGAFVVHEHHATRTHWDLRLEIDGVLVSWAVPHGPSMNPDDKRLAVKVEVHPLEYVDFEAVIPAGNYGAGPIIVWDRGRFLPQGDPREGLRAGEIKFELAGYKLRGAFTIVRTAGRASRGQRGSSSQEQWLLIKKRDGWSGAFLAGGRALSPASVLSGLSAEELAGGAPRIAAVRAELAVSGAPRATISPHGFVPMLCETAEAPFSSKDWIFELKYDGYRLLGWGGAGAATVRYRSGRDPSARYPELLAGLRALPVPGLVLDGEVVAEEADGRPSIKKIAERAQLVRKPDIARAAVIAPVTWFVFDLLAADGVDLRGLPLERRKELLARIVPAVGPIRLAEHIPERGEAFLAAVVQRGLEGVVGKRLGSRYRAGARAKDWLKIKVDPEGDFAVCGFTAPRGSRAGIGAANLCVWDGDSWQYAGRVGSGFDDAELIALRKELERLPRWTPTFPRPEDVGEDPVWIEPTLVLTVRYREWRAGGTLRFPVFVRRRDDKRAIECTMPARDTGELMERSGDGEPAPARVAAAAADQAATDATAGDRIDEPPAAAEPEDADDGGGPARKLQLTNLKKVYWPADHITKGDLVEYYRAVAPWMLPYLVDRPVVMTRYPDGIDGKMFYQKDTPDWVPPWLRTVALWSEHSQRDVHYVIVDDADGLAFLANLGSIPIHVWASRTTDLGRPDWSIIDLDPKGAPREHVVPLALAIHELCESIALPSYVKTSGQTGLHVLIPMGGQVTFEQARHLAYVLGMVIERRHPDKATTHRNPRKRGGKVYLDWGQNAHGQLLVAPYSVRPVPGAPVSMPLRWHEVVPGLDARAFNVRNALDRLQSPAFGADPVRPVLTERPDLLAALGRLQALLAE